MILMVSYDLKTPGKDYEKLYNVLKSAPSWWHHLESTWVLSTNENVEIWADRIRNATDTNDFFIVIDITKMPRQGWLPEKAWNWLTEHEGP